MRFAFSLAVRYFRQPRRSLLARLTAVAAIAGIAFGTAAMIAALALANGFRRAMQEKILANTAHISIFRANDDWIENWKNVGEQIETIEGVAKVSAQTFDNALLIGKTNSAFAVLRASEKKSEISNLKSETTSNERRTTIKVKIGRILAENVGLKAGDAAEIVSGNGRLNENFAPISTVVEVTAIFETGLYEYDATWIRVSLADAAKITGKSEVQVSSLGVETSDIYRANETAREIAKKLGAEYKVLDWQEANRPLFAALALERRVAVAIVGLIVFVAALNVATTLALTIGERRFDIAVLRACGASERKIVSIFLCEGLLLTVVGLTFGVLLGISICFLANCFDLISLPANVYEVGKISVRTSLPEISFVVVLVLALGFLASWLPARAAARMRPLENLKN